jgi:hypothetical protein
MSKISQVIGECNLCALVAFTCGSAKFGDNCQMWGTFK